MAGFCLARQLQFSTLTEIRINIGLIIETAPVVEMSAAGSANHPVRTLVETREKIGAVLMDGCFGFNDGKDGASALIDKFIEEFGAANQKYVVRVVAVQDIIQFLNASDSSGAGNLKVAFVRQDNVGTVRKRLFAGQSLQGMATVNNDFILG